MWQQHTSETRQAVKLSNPDYAATWLGAMGLCDFGLWGYILFQCVCMYDVQVMRGGVSNVNFVCRVLKIEFVRFDEVEEGQESEGGSSIEVDSIHKATICTIKDSPCFYLCPCVPVFACNIIGCIL